MPVVTAAYIIQTIVRNIALALTVTSYNIRSDAIQ